MTDASSCDVIIVNPANKMPLLNAFSLFLARSPILRSLIVTEVHRRKKLVEDGATEGISILYFAL